ncbi:sigma factor [Nocardioides aromaticivorans]|uniref:sigma factor n=1 Tax=Nocardioides aromaticivorans TaxID=200618 RepID=UPI001F5C1479|nr:sigma factor [Nocardioides aromaticivorans]
MDARADFDAFVGARSSALLRTAYLLTRDHALAEDLLQTALTKAWFAWRRVDGDPEAYVRRILVNTYATWWRRRWNGGVTGRPCRGLRALRHTKWSLQRAVRMTSARTRAGPSATSYEVVAPARGSYDVRPHPRRTVRDVMRSGRPSARFV